MYVTVGFGGLSCPQVLNRLADEYKKTVKAEQLKKPELPEKSPAKTSTHFTQGVEVKGIPFRFTGLQSLRIKETDRIAALQTELRKLGVQVEVEGDSSMLVKFARCCNPLPGDLIVGYVTRGRGVSIHRADCANMMDDSIEPDRFVRVNWVSQSTEAYEAEIYTLQEYAQRKKEISEKIEELEQQAAQRRAEARAQTLDPFAFAKKVQDVLKILKDPTQSESAKNAALKTVVSYIVYDKPACRLAVFFYA